MTYWYYGLGVADTVDAKPIYVDAWRAEYGVDPTPTETHAVLAVARLESGYGEGWKGLMVGSHNQGAIQCLTRPDKNQPPELACPPGCALNADSHASGEMYNACFKTYPSDFEGARDLIRRLNVSGIKEALATGDAVLIATRMRKSRYYEEKCLPTDPGGLQCGDEPRILRYAAKIARNAKELAAKLGEPVLVTMPADGDDSSSSFAGSVIGGVILGLFALGTVSALRARK